MSTSHSFAISCKDGGVRPVPAIICSKRPATSIIFCWERLHASGWLTTASEATAFPASMAQASSASKQAGVDLG